MALGVLLGCGSSRALTPPPTSGEAQTPPARRLSAPEALAGAEAETTEADPDRGSTGLDEQRAREESLEILAEISEARALALQGEPQVDVISRKGIRSFARKSMYEHTTPDEFQLLTRIEASFGVIPADVDGESILLDMLESGVLGLYDPKRETLFIGDFVPKTMLSMVVGHEIVHGLQDMHFDLEALQTPIDHQSDAESARTFLIEGDAQAAYLAWVSGEEGLEAIEDAVFTAMGDQALGLSEAVSPYPILARQLQLPYADGTATVAQIARKDGWQAIDALYADLPATTEQMLHADKLRAREPAIAIDLDPAPIAEVTEDMQQVYHDTLGEAALLAMLAEVAPPSRARAAAAGWGGGRYLVFDRQPRDPVPLVTGLLAWDTATDAEEFAPMFRRYLRLQIGDDFLLVRDDVRVWFALRIPTGVDEGRLRRALRAAATLATGPKGEAS